MYKVITTVGASLFTNYRDYSKDLDDDINKLENKPSSEYDKYKERVNNIFDKITSTYPKIDSAELKSTSKIQNYYGDIQVELIATDTAISRLAAEIIKDILNKKTQTQAFFNPATHLIRDLQIENSESFVRLGLPNLIRTIDHLSGGYYDNVIFNITGGYKGVIPFLTLMASVHGSKILYIYEDTENLITIPRFPLEINETIFDEYTETIHKLKHGIKEYAREKNNNFKIYDLLEQNGLVETDGKSAFLSPIGHILYNRYKKNRFIFFATDEVYSDIEKKEIILRIIKEKFSDKEKRDNKTEWKNNHQVYDDGDNPFRIFYAEADANIYIYKVFTDHNLYERYLNDNPSFDLNEYKKNARLRIIKLT